MLQSDLRSSVVNSAGALGGALSTGGNQETNDASSVKADTSSMMAQKMLLDSGTVVRVYRTMIV